MTPCPELPTGLALGSAYSAKTPYSGFWSELITQALGLAQPFLNANIVINNRSPCRLLASTVSVLSEKLSEP